MESVLTVTVNVLVLVEEADGVFYADCPFLNIVSQGHSEEDALARFEQEMYFLFETCVDTEQLEALLDHRTTLRRNSSSPDDSAAVKRRVSADIPAALLKRFTDAAAAFH